MADPRDPDLADDPWVLQLAADVADGRPVDWPAVDGQATSPGRRAVVDELRSLAAIASAHLGGADSPTAGPPEASEPPGSAPEIGVWLHLRLLERVGSGTGGVVFRALDTRLDREVALKLLSPRSWRGRAPLQEARLLARVRHPNVVTVYDADEDAQGQVGIWMEFIRGETLGDMVQARGPMSAREVAGIGIDLCRALSAVHGVGLLHRDLKAHNVMRERGGRIVLMDFSTVRAADSGDRATVGTPLYMAPELFRGEAESPVTDVYGLGVLLFFLLTGRFPVEGPTASDVKAAHEHGVRHRLADLCPAVPAAVARVIERAVSSDPHARYPTPGELEHALTAASGSVTSTDPTAVGEGPPRWTWGFVAGLVLVAAAAGLWAGRTPQRPPEGMLQFTMGTPLNAGSWPRLSPDGRRVVYGAVSEGRSVVLWVRDLGSLAARPLSGSAATETPFWSPDSRAVAYYDAGSLRRVNVDTAEVFTIADAPQGRGGDWHDNGTILFAPAIGRGIYRVRADGSGLGAVTTVSTDRGEYQHAWPEFLPDGRRFLFIIRSTRPDVSGVYLGSLDAEAPRRILPAHSRTVYADSGHLLYVRDGVLLAHPFEARAGVLTGDPVPIVPSVKWHEGGDAAFDVSSGRALIYRPAEGLPLTRLVLVDREGHEQQVVAGAAVYRHPRYSPDATRVAVERVAGEGQRPDVWLYDLVRGTNLRLTTDQAADVRPVWSPDGRRIAFASGRDRRFVLFTRPVDEVGDEQQLAAPDQSDAYPEHWSADGRYLSFVLAGEGLWVLPVQGGRPALIRPRIGGGDPSQSAFSPDGRWLAYTSVESGTLEVYVEPFPPTGARWQVSTGGGGEPHWRGDGRELFYLSADQTIMSVPIAAGASFVARAPVPLFKVSVPDVYLPSDVDVRPDGQQFVVNTLVERPATPPIHVVVHWTGLLGGS